MLLLGARSTPQNSNSKPPASCKSGKSYIGGSGDRFGSYRWFSRTGGCSSLRISRTTRVAKAWRACPGPGPSEVVGDNVNKMRPAGPAEAKRHGLAARRFAGGRPEAVNDHIKQKVFCRNDPRPLMSLAGLWPVANVDFIGGGLGGRYPPPQAVIWGAGAPQRKAGGPRGGSPPAGGT